MLRPLIIASLFIIPGVSQALEIRNYSPARHDRFITSNGITVPNPGAFYNGTFYTGVGYGDGGMQYALISPEHVVFAKHFVPATNGTYAIHFRNNSGAVVSRIVTGSTQVPNGSGGIADVIILKLDVPILPETGITPLPYLNLPSELAYAGMQITMFGQSLRAGLGAITDFQNFSQTNANIGSTRSYTTYYSVAGNQDDAVAVSGDSGSPSFAMANNRPALVGIHLAAGTLADNVTRVTLDTFVPHYAETINSLLAGQGYQLIPANTSTVALASEISTPPLRQAETANITITLTNTTRNADATNPRLKLVFPADAIPASVTAPGWITHSPAPGDFRLRSASLTSRTTVSANISYTSVPSVREISFQSTFTSDGSADTEVDHLLPVMETFAGFTTTLPLKGELDDPDSDGFSNLLEYAFGGSPGKNSNLAEGGYPLAPQSSEENGLTFTYARRTDAVERGLSYRTEFSQTLAEISWTTSPPSGATSSVVPFAPDIPGFEKVIVTIPTSPAEKRFVRVGVTLNE